MERYDVEMMRVSLDSQEEAPTEVLSDKGKYIRHDDLRALLTMSDKELSEIWHEVQWGESAVGYAQRVLAHLRTKAGLDAKEGKDG